MQEKKYLLVDSAVLPEVFLRVLKAKELLANGEAKSVSRAAQMAEISRSAFYKYKDSVFQANIGEETMTITASLLDETGALQALLGAISAAGGGVVTINQSMPENGAAKVAITLRTVGMQMGPEELCDMLRKQKTVIDLRMNTP